MIGDLLLRLTRGLCDGRRDLPRLLVALDRELQEHGLDALAQSGFGDRAARGASRSPPPSTACAACE